MANVLDLDSYRASYEPRRIKLGGETYTAPKLAVNEALQIERAFVEIAAAADADTGALFAKLSEVSGIPAAVLGSLSMDELQAVQAFLSRSQELDRKRYATATGGSTS